MFWFCFICLTLGIWGSLMVNGHINQSYEESFDLKSKPHIDWDEKGWKEMKGVKGGIKGWKRMQWKGKEWYWKGTDIYEMEVNHTQKRT